MTIRKSCLLVPLAAALGLALSGCFPPPTGAGDEEKEPYFRKGEELASSQDIPGAVEAFEKALEVNPHNSLAHYRLGLLCEREDPATAMYHFNCFLKRSRDPALSERARERVTACRTVLAQSVALSMTPGLERLQKEVERLTLTNRDLALRLDSWGEVGGPQSPAAAASA
jgi:tetratricopeptide (TPR) repeat protein